MASVLRGSGDSSFGGNLSIEGVLTYEDVASVDSIGIITARSGIDVGTGTSISSPSSNVLTLGTNNEERLRIDSAGNIGINDTGPDFTLDVNGDIGIREGNNLVFHDGSGTAAFRIQGTSGNALVFERASNNKEQMRIDNGKLLVGDPSDITGVSNNSISLVDTGRPIFALGRNDSTVAADVVIADIRFYGTGGDGSTWEECASIKTEADDTHATGDKPSRLVFSTNGGSPDTSSTERMRIDSSGRLLVGTVSNSGGADIQASNSLSVGGLIKREFSKGLELSDNVEATYLTFSIPGGTAFTSSANVGAEISYVITANRLTSGRESRSTYGKVFVAINRHWESNTNNPVAVTLVDTDKALCKSGSSGTPIITWSTSVEAGIDSAAKEVYIKVTVDNPSTITTLTEITGTVTYHTRVTGSDAVTVS